MLTIDLIRDNLARSRDRVLRRVEEMRPHALVPATVNGGAHTLWVLGHLACMEGLVVRRLMLGEPNPLAAWETPFDGSDVSADPGAYPSFDEALATCRRMRQETLTLLDTFTEPDLDRPAVEVPPGFEDCFGTRRLCLQYAADHWYMHRGQLADARRAAGLERMWV